MCRAGNAATANPKATIAFVGEHLHGLILVQWELIVCMASQDVATSNAFYGAMVFVLPLRVYQKLQLRTETPGSPKGPPGSRSGWAVWVCSMARSRFVVPQRSSGCSVCTFSADLSKVCVCMRECATCSLGYLRSTSSFFFNNNEPTKHVHSSPRHHKTQPKQRHQSIQNQFAYNKFYRTWV